MILRGVDDSVNGHLHETGTCPWCHADYSFLLYVVINNDDIFW
jgi:hypothetical protein